jgi:hypothetical protein
MEETTTRPAATMTTMEEEAEMKTVIDEQIKQAVSDHEARRRSFTEGPSPRQGGQQQLQEEECRPPLPPKSTAFQANSVEYLVIILCDMKT